MRQGQGYGDDVSLVIGDNIATYGSPCFRPNRSRV
jgi:hypothetical protein